MIKYMAWASEMETKAYYSIYSNIYCQTRDRTGNKN